MWGRRGGCGCPAVPLHAAESPGAWQEAAELVIQAPGGGEAVRGLLHLAGEGEGKVAQRAPGLFHTPRCPCFVLREVTTTWSTEGESRRCLWWSPRAWFLGVLLQC